ncbi:hypothetical protein WAC47_28205, partial [Klebsiella pneumoniae]
GATVIYTRQGPRGAELATVSVDGRVRQQLRQTGDVRAPAWAPFPVLEQEFHSVPGQGFSSERRLGV